MNKLNEALASELKNIFPQERLFFAEPMQSHTTFRIGGPADCLVMPADLDEICLLQQKCQAYHTPLLVLGNGSNVLIKDKGVRGVVMVLGRPFAQIKCENNKITASAGMILGNVAQLAAKNALSGLEFAVGIPGSLGGAIFMNAGAYDGEMKNVVTAVTSLTTEGKLVRRSVEELGLGYRDSIYQHNNEIICEIEMTLQAGEAAAIKEKMSGFTQKRIAKQPLDQPSAGSTFKRPAGYFAGTLIEQTGLKGFTIGDAMVSNKHAGFVVNNGKATADDVQRLIQEVCRRVKEKFNVELTPEVRIIGE